MGFANFLIILKCLLRLLNDTEIAKSKRDFELKKAAYDVEVQTKARLKQSPLKIYFNLNYQLF